MITAIVAGIVLFLCLALVVAVARDPGPPPGEVAIAYELAWDRLDFETLWALSGTELRDDRPKHDFVASKRAAYDRAPGLAGLARNVTLEEVAAGADAAVARTRVELTDGAVARNELHFARRDGTWLVVAYELRESSDAQPGA